MSERQSLLHDDDLARFWDAVIRGDTDPETGTIDSSDIRFVRQMHTLAQAQTPAGARDRAWATANVARMTRTAPLNGKGTHVTTTSTLAGPFVPILSGNVSADPATAHHRITRRASRLRRVGYVGGTAAIAFFSVLMLFIYYQSGNNHGAIPPFQKSASPTSETTPESTGETPAVEFIWSAMPIDRDALFHPLTIRLAPDNRLWVADSTSRWFIFDTEGELEDIWGRGGRGPGEFNFRYDYGNGTVAEMASIAFAEDGSFYIVDTFNHRIQRFDPQRNLVATWGSRGKENGQFLLASGITIESNGTLLITDVERGDVQRFAADGTFMSAFAATSSPNSHLVTPLIAVSDAAGLLYVAEAEANRIRVFGPEGTQLLLFGFNTEAFSGLRIPSDLALDANGNVFVNDTENSRIVVFDAEGNYRFSWGERGIGDGQFLGTGGIALGPDNVVYVVDWEGNRIQKFQVVEPGAATPTP